MSHPIPSPQDDRSILRQLKILVMLLLLSNVALGVFAFYFLRGIDRKYSTLIGDIVPTLNDLQGLTVSTNEAMHGTNPAFIPSAESITVFVQHGREALAQARAIVQHPAFGRLDRESVLEPAHDALGFGRARHGRGKRGHGR